MCFKSSRAVWSKLFNQLDPPVSNQSWIHNVAIPVMDRDRIYCFTSSKLNFEHLKFCLQYHWRNKARTRLLTILFVRKQSKGRVRDLQSFKNSIQSSCGVFVQFKHQPTFSHLNIFHCTNSQQPIDFSSIGDNNLQLKNPYAANIFHWKLFLAPGAPLTLQGILRMQNGKPNSMFPSSGDYNYNNSLRIRLIDAIN